MLLVYLGDKILPNIEQIDLLHINSDWEKFVEHADNIFPFKIKTLHLGGSDISRLKIDEFCRLQRVTAHHTLHSLIFVSH